MWKEGWMKINNPTTYEMYLIWMKMQWKCLGHVPIQSSSEIGYNIILPRAFKYIFRYSFPFTFFCASNSSFTGANALCRWGGKCNFSHRDPVPIIRAMLSFIYLSVCLSALLPGLLFGTVHQCLLGFVRVCHSERVKPEREREDG